MVPPAAVSALTATLARMTQDELDELRASLLHRLRPSPLGSVRFGVHGGDPRCGGGHGFESGEEAASPLTHRS